MYQLYPETSQDDMPNIELACVAGQTCESPRVSKGDMLNVGQFRKPGYTTLCISPLLTRGLVHFVATVRCSGLNIYSNVKLFGTNSSEISSPATLALGSVDSLNVNTTGISTCFMPQPT